MHRSEDNPFNIAATPEPEQGLGRPISEADPSAVPTDDRSAGFRPTRLP
jgi:hypothetical protein